MTETIKADICVIGAGSGGLSVAAGAQQMGADTVLLEKGKMGGDATGDVFDARGVDAKVFDDVRAGRDVGGAERGECDDGGV